MRLSSKLFILLSATTVFSDIISDTVSDILSNVDISAIGKCKAVLDEYKECQVDFINLDSVATNIDNFCTNFATEKCQGFYKQGVTRIPECQDISKELLAPGQIFTDMYYSFLTLGCSKDENNNYCPLAGTNIITSKRITEEEFTSSLNETCKSKKCYDVATDTFTRVETSELLIRFLFSKQLNNLNMTTQDDRIDKINDFLKSENCTSQHIIKPSLANVESSESSAVVKSINMSLFIGLSLLLSILL